MKKMKFSVIALSAAMLLSSCGGLTNTAKGGMIGGAGGAGLGALIGSFIGHGKGAAIGAAIGTAVGAGAGVLIGNKMDKAKKAAELANAKAEVLTDEQGLQYVKATFDSGLLFQTGSSNLSPSAKMSINKFINGLVSEDNTYDLAVCGFTDNAGWRNSSPEESRHKNQTLSQERADAVRYQIVSAGYPSARLVNVKGYGEEYPVADNSTAAGKAENRRVEVYILPSKDMIETANQNASK